MMGIGPSNRPSRVLVIPSRSVVTRYAIHALSAIVRAMWASRRIPFLGVYCKEVTETVWHAPSDRARFRAPGLPPLNQLRFRRRVRIGRRRCAGCRWMRLRRSGCRSLRLRWLRGFLAAAEFLQTLDLLHVWDEYGVGRIGRQLRAEAV